MTPEEPTGRLSSISTRWSVLRCAHDSQSAEAAAARADLWQRYSGAVRRYLLALLGDAHAAEDLTQEFAVCLLRGEFRQADPRFGRFRHYVKAVLRHLVSRHRAREQKQPDPLPPDNPVWTDLAAADEAEHQFKATWRDDLLHRAMEALARSHAEYHTVLQFRAANPKMPSHKMAEPLSQLLGKPVNAAGVRQALHRARAHFCRLLRAEVAESLDSPTPEQVDDELRELDLLVYCQHEAE